MKNITRNKLNFRNSILRLILMMFTVVVAYPIIWTLYTSLKTNKEFLMNIWSLPQVMQWDNYLRAIEQANMGEYFMNSIMITAFSIIFLLLLAVPASYVLSRFKFRLNKFISLFFMAGLFVSSSYTVIPLFIMLNKWGWLNNRLAISLVYAVTTLPFNIYLLTGFFKGLSTEYEAAANIDGCGYFKTLLYVMVPMVKPGMVTVLMFGFMAYWNEYIVAFTLLREDRVRTLSVGLKNLMEIQQYATDWGAMFAGLVIVMLPTMIFYALVQKKLTAGLSLGGLKG